MSAFPESILELSKWTYFPSILGLKICPRCKHITRIQNFWRASKLTWCKNCERCRTINYKKEKQAAYQKTPRYLRYAAGLMRVRRKTPAGAAQNRKDNRTYAKRWPEKQHAHEAVARAIKSGRLVRQPCQECGAADAEAHHPDYSKPLEVSWLCGEHHREEHLTGQAPSSS